MTKIEAKNAQRVVQPTEYRHLDRGQLFWRNEEDQGDPAALYVKGDEVDGDDDTWSMRVVDGYMRAPEDDTYVYPVPDSIKVTLLYGGL